MSEFKFDPGSITVAPGKVVFYVVNAGTVSHDMVVQDGAGSRVGRSDLIAAGDASTFTIDNLQPGIYNYFCDQPGHEASGMKGTLTVT